MRIFTNARCEDSFGPAGFLVGMPKVPRKIEREKQKNLEKETASKRIEKPLQNTAHPTCSVGGYEEAGNRGKYHGLRKKRFWERSGRGYEKKK